MLLIVREEIISLIILIFITSYYVINKQKDKNNHFLTIMLTAIAHVALDLITVITVNNRDVVPDVLNRTLHILYYMSGILFSRAFYRYILNLSGLYQNRWLYILRSNIPIFIFFTIMLFLPIEYRTGNGTDYSYGLVLFIGYGIFAIYCIISFFVLICFKNKFEKRVRRAVIPMVTVMAVAVSIQAFVPELLMTGGGLTFICIGIFVSLDNPDIDFKKHALWDFLTGLKNQNSYKKDIGIYKNRSKFKKKQQTISIVVADLNSLKYINDNYGHDEGDRLIAAAGSVLKDNLVSAEDVYRLGGDEFSAVFLNIDKDIIAAEIEAVKKACKANNDFVVPLSIAIGCASGVLDENADKIFNLADKNMYLNKIQMKQMNKI